MMSATKAERAQALRYKKPALMSLGYYAITQELNSIVEACCDVHWFFDTDEETLLNALDGDSDEEWEFKMAFADLEAKADQLQALLRGGIWPLEEQEFDDCIVALIGNRYKEEMWGFDVLEEDYYSLASYDAECATKEAGKRLMRLSKANMIARIGQCLGILIVFLDLRQQYDYLKATMDILRDENTSLLKTIKEIDAAYETAEKASDGFKYCWHDECERFDALLKCLPDRAWLE